MLNKVKNYKKMLLVIVILVPIFLEISLFSNINLNINKSSIIRIGVEYGILILIGIFFLLNKYCKVVKKCVDFVFDHRYLIGLVAFVIMVIFKLNFSSIGWWSNVIPSDNNTTVVGIQRSIRSDEWLVQTPFFLAQSMNNKFYPRTNDNVRYDGQNMLMVYPAPVFDITLISKPMNWGFFIFGRDRGLSWYFAMTTILLLLFSIEFISILTNKDKLLSLSGGIMIAISPAIMWWYSSNAIIYLSAFAIMIIFHYYMKNLESSIYKKIWLAICMVSAVTGFVLCFYPALQVPILYIVLAFCLVEYIENFKKIKLKDYIIIFVVVIFICIILGYYFYVSFDEIKTMLSTTYPGKRCDLGGSYNIGRIINYSFGLFTPFYDSFDYSLGNECEVASFIYPVIGLIIVIIGLLKGNIKEKIKDNKFIALLVVIYIFEFIYIFLGFNTLIAKISFLSMSTPSRTMLALGITGSILVVVILKKMSDKKIQLFSKKQALVISIIVCIIAVLLIKVTGYSNYFGKLKLLILLPFIGTMTYLFITFNKKGFAYLMAVTALICGATINPITYSTDAIYKTNTSEKIQEIVSSNKEAVWAGEKSYEAQFAIANGARVLNGVNYYPNFKWLKLLDKSGKYDFIYNRYAHIYINLCDVTEFKLLTQDSYEVSLTPENFKQLGIDYYITDVNLDSTILKKYNMALVFYDEKEGQRIYSVKDN